MNTQIIICDDDPDDVKTTKKIISRLYDSKQLSYSIIEFHSGEQLIEALSNHTILPSIIFMDILFLCDVKSENSNINLMSGIQAAKFINEFLPDCHIIYLTNHLQYATDVYETEHRYYILKSELPIRIHNVFNKIYQSLESDLDISISLKHAGDIILFRKEIVLLERYGRGTKVVTRDETYESSISLNDLGPSIGAEYLIPCHKSFYINLRHVKSYQRDQLLMHTGMIVPISRKYQAFIRDAFTQWTKNHLF